MREWFGLIREGLSIVLPGCISVMGVGFVFASPENNDAGYHFVTIGIALEILFTFRRNNFK